MYPDYLNFTMKYCMLQNFATVKAVLKKEKNKNGNENLVR